MRRCLRAVDAGQVDVHQDRSLKSAASTDVSPDSDRQSLRNPAVAQDARCAPKSGLVVDDEYLHGHLVF
jgi:hypothetical protein